MQFTTKVNGIPCKCHVLVYEPGNSLHIFGSELPDFDIPTTDKFKYEFLDQKGNRAKWLDQYDSSAVAARLLEEWQCDVGSESSGRYL